MGRREYLLTWSGRVSKKTEAAGRAWEAWMLATCEWWQEQYSILCTTMVQVIRVLLGFSNVGWRMQTRISPLSLWHSLDICSNLVIITYPSRPPLSLSFLLRSVHPWNRLAAKKSEFWNCYKSIGFSNLQEYNGDIRWHKNFIDQIFLHK